MKSDASVRTLHLLRHAKSSWDDAGLPDHDRPLAPRGRRAVKKLGAYMKRSGVRPDLVLCSTARRTTETLEGVRPALGHPLVHLDPALYAAPEAGLLEVVTAVAPYVHSLLVIGHNPGLQALAVGLADRGGGQLRARLSEKMPTGALATLTFEANAWSDVAPGRCQLVAYVVPRDLE